MNTIRVVLLIFYVTIFQVYSRESMFQKAFQFLHHRPPPPRKQIRIHLPNKWIEQKVDNFNDNDKRTWQMRYKENDRFFKPGGPMFIYVNGEWELTDYELLGGLIYDMAKVHKAYIFSTEHRYYGESYPTKDLSVKNLKYLNVDQSLADLAHFIKTIKKTYPGMQKSKVMLFGVSYTASMVTWFQRIYPGLAVGSWASGGPLLAKVDFKEYYELVGRGINFLGGIKCYNRIKTAFNEMEILIHKNSSYITKLFKICNNFDFNNKFDIYSFFLVLASPFGSLVQNHYNTNIQDACKVINSIDNDLMGLLHWYRDTTETSTCNDFSYAGMLSALSYLKTNHSLDARQWYYQMCSEFGWFQTLNSKHQPFGSSLPLILDLKTCRDIFGKRFTKKAIYENVRRTNEIYGGLNPGVTNVIFTYGGIDPWQALGMLETNGESNVVPLYGHGLDFGSIRDRNTDEMKTNKLKIVSKVAEWLSSPTNASPTVIMSTSSNSYSYTQTKSREMQFQFKPFKFSRMKRIFKPKRRSRRLN